jgi:linoleoyl-CoA desaturase
LQTITDSGFGRELIARVADGLSESALAEARDRLHRKAMVVVAWYLTSYVFMLLAQGWILGGLACLSLALSIGAVGFNIQHDANHNAFFRSPTRRLSTANRIAGFSLNAIGGSSARWIDGHVRQHHVSTNIVGKDFDIELPPFARLAPSQRHRTWHAFQHLYLWVIYGFTTTGIIVGDVVGTVQESISGDRRGRTPSLLDYVVLVGSKGLFVGVMLVIPMFLHPWWVVVLGAVFVLGLSGFLLGTVFQLAHAVEEADFADAGDPATTRWHEWQVRTTVDFCHGSGRVARVVTWYAGGLNFQTEHHLFPSLPHTAYPDIAPIVARTCADFGIRYQVQPTLRAALRSHYRHVRMLGRPSPAPAPPVFEHDVPAEVADAGAEQHRDLADADLVDEAEVQRLLDDVGAGDRDPLVAGERLR